MRESEFRVRGTLDEFALVRRKAPHPDPLPAKSGEREEGTINQLVERPPGSR